MLGAIVGDIVGSVHEFANTRTKNFELMPEDAFATDDSFLTLAVARHLLDGVDLIDEFHAMVERFPDAGWGARFGSWGMKRERRPYNSFGNGAAMRVSPVALLSDTREQVLAVAERVTAVTHDHPEGIRGAQAAALATFLARSGASKADIRDTITDRFAYDLSRTIDEIRPTYRYNETCQETVPQAIRAFIDSTDFEDALRNAVSIGGDADTLAAIAGGIAGAYYGVPAALQKQALDRLPDDLKTLAERVPTKTESPRA